MTGGTAAPVYLRIRAALAAAIADGRYGDGAQLPSVRALALEHRANPLTVAKAYQSLQDDGHVAVRRGVGMFVTPGAAARLRAEERERFLRETWPQVQAEMLRLQIDPRALLRSEPAAAP